MINKKSKWENKTDQLICNLSLFQIKKENDRWQAEEVISSVTSFV